jgi:hypothetical protein
MDRNQAADNQNSFLKTLRFPLGHLEKPGFALPTRDMDRTGLRPLDSRPNLSGHNNVSLPGSGHIVQLASSRGQKMHGIGYPRHIVQGRIDQGHIVTSPAMGQQGREVIRECIRGKGSYKQKVLQETEVGEVGGRGGDRMQS